LRLGVFDPATSLQTGLGGDDEIFGDSVVVTNDLSVWDGVTPYTTIVNWRGSP
jgi:hypothetical protein